MSENVTIVGEAVALVAYALLLAESWPHATRTKRGAYCLLVGVALLHVLASWAGK
jgi:hypothetical protein